MNSRIVIFGLRVLDRLHQPREERVAVDQRLDPRAGRQVEIVETALLAVGIHRHARLERGHQAGGDRQRRRQRAAVCVVSQASPSRRTDRPGQHAERPWPRTISGILAQRRRCADAAETVRRVGAQLPAPTPAPASNSTKDGSRSPPAANNSCVHAGKLAHAHRARGEPASPTARIDGRSATSPRVDAQHAVRR